MATLEARQLHADQQRVAGDIFGGPDLAVAVFAV